MNRVHGEPKRGLPTRCPTCGLPYDVDHAGRLMDRVPVHVQGWTLCRECGESTHPELKRVIAEEIEGGVG